MKRAGTRHGGYQTRRFTFLELMLAMAVVVVAALLAFKFFSNMQNVWEASMSASSTHDDGRLALELMASDLNVAIAREDDQPGRDILFHQPSSAELWFVTVAHEDSTSDCAIVEVAYRLTGNALERAFVDDSCAQWNVYGPRDNADDQDGFRTVVDNVIDLDIACYNQGLSTVVPEQSNRLPCIVSLSLTVLDRDHMKRWVSLDGEARLTFEKQFARTFWKTVRLR